MFVVVWYSGECGNLFYSGGSAGEALAKFDYVRNMGIPVEYQEWDDEGTLIHWKYRGRKS
jgi:hypothetical protein